MQNQDQQSQRTLFQETSQNLNMFVGAAQCVCKPIEALLRRPGTWGNRYMNFQALLGWIFCFMFSSFYRETYPPYYRSICSPMPMFYLFLGITGMLLVHRVAGVWRRWRGCPRQHSAYSGTPWLKGFSEVSTKTYLEPLLLIVGGISLTGFNVPLGAYLAISGIALGINGFWQAAADHARIRSALDAQIDGEWMMSQVQRKGH